MFRRPATGLAVMDDYGNGGGGDDNSCRSVDDHRQWSNDPSADIVEYDSSVAADTPSAQRAMQLLLPTTTTTHQHQQQRVAAAAAANNHFSQKHAANYSGGTAGSTIAPGTAAVIDPSSVRGTKSSTAATSTWKTGALYVFLACLLAVVVVNLTLTLWFIRVTRFTSVRHRGIYKGHPTGAQG